MADKNKSRKSFRKEYLIVLRDRDQQYLRHDKEKEAWNRERQKLLDNNEQLNTAYEARNLEVSQLKGQTTEKVEYRFAGKYLRSPGEYLDVLAVVRPEFLDKFMNGDDVTNGRVRLIDKMEGGSFWGDRGMVRWERIETHVTAS